MPELLHTPNVATPIAARAAQTVSSTGRIATAPFNEWKYTDCKTAVDERKPKDYERLKDFAVRHDHRRNGDEWVGPGDARTSDGIKKQFAADDFIAEALRNIANAFEEAQMGFAPLEPVAEGAAPSTEYTTRRDELLKLLSDWWDQNKLHKRTLNRLKAASWAGYAGLRLWVPGRFLQRGPSGISFRPTNDFAEALSYLKVAAPEPEKAAIITHPDSQDICSVYLDEEVTNVGGQEKRVQRAEMVYLDPQRERDEDADTIIRVVYSDERTPTVARLKLGGRSLYAEMESEAILTEPVLETQNQLNFYCTIITRLGETAAFRERYTKNSRPMGIRIKYTEGDTIPYGAHLERDDEYVQWVVIPVPRTFGANTTNELVGLPKHDKDGNFLGYESPDVHVENPVDPMPYVLAAESIRKRGLRMVSQGHLANTSTAELSGIAYEQFRSAFEKFLNNVRVGEEGMLRDLLMAAVALIEHITGRGGYFTKVLRITIDQRVNAGPRSPEATRIDMEANEKGLLSDETAMARIGVEDIDAEIERLRASPRGVLAVLEKIQAIVTAFSPEAALRLLEAFGLPKNIIDALTPKPGDTPKTLPAEPTDPKPKLIK